MTKEFVPTQGQRIMARNDTTATALLGDLDAQVAKVQKQEGLVGNCKGKVEEANRALIEAQSELARLTARAVRVKRSFDAYMGDDVDVHARGGGE